jgi:hypothetical protein
VRPISHSEQTEAYGTSDALLEIANADWMNNTPKYVTSSWLESPEWQNVLSGDVKEAVTQLK